MDKKKFEPEALQVEWTLLICHSNLQRNKTNSNILRNDRLDNFSGPNDQNLEKIKGTRLILTVKVSFEKFRKFKKKNSEESDRDARLPSAPGDQSRRYFYRRPGHDRPGRLARLISFPASRVLLSEVTLDLA
ncbi:hypothetical protein PV326_014225 [Microctonus aethiopoides]|nr:hypothetical protein PV326_014225 [Microctonus aethiopoides]